jgi:Arm DNA-binding domain
MAKTTDQLSDRNCRTASTGKHHDGMGLYLSCRAGTARVIKSWLFRYELNGKAAWMGLGSYPIVTLAHARRKADAARAMLADGERPAHTQARSAGRAASA